MKAFLIFEIIAALGLAAGCSAYRPASADTRFDSAYAESHPQPAASPSQRPGMNPNDPRDAQYLSRPGADVTPPTATKP
jgi:hypothetical protein